MYVEAVNRLLLTQQRGDPKLRVKPDALLLTAACVWLINSLHSRPDDGKASKALMQRILPLTDSIDPDPNTLLFRSWDYRDDTDDYWIPFSPYGAIFLRRVMLDVEVPRMALDTYVTPLPEDCFSYLFDATEEHIRHKYAPVGIIPRGVEATQRVVTNKTQRTPRFVEEAHENEPTHRSLLFDLASKGFKLPPPTIDDGSDMEVDGEPVAPCIVRTIDEVVTEMYRQFLSDVINKSPSPRSSSLPSYCTLTASQKLTVTEDLYKNINFKDIWRQCNWKITQKNDWELAFSHLFPERSHEASSRIQNYTQCRYYQTWKEICTTADPACVDAIRAAIRKRVSRFKWLPYACCDKMWRTSTKEKKGDKVWVRFPPGSSGPAPHIISRIKPCWNEPEEVEILELE